MNCRFVCSPASKARYQSVERPGELSLLVVSRCRSDTSVPVSGRLVARRANQRNRARPIAASQRPPAPARNKGNGNHYEIASQPVLLTRDVGERPRVTS